MGKKLSFIPVIISVDLVVNLNEGAHLPALLPVPRHIVQHDVRGPDPVPRQPRVRDVRVVTLYKTKKIIFYNVVFVL